MAEDEAEEREKEETHGAFQPSALANVNSLWQTTWPSLPSFKVQRRLKPPNKKGSSVWVASPIRFSKGKGADAAGGSRASQFYGWLYQQNPRALPEEYPRSGRRTERDAVSHHGSGKRVNHRPVWSGSESVKWARDLSPLWVKHEGSSNDCIDCSRR